MAPHCLQDRSQAWHSSIFRAPPSLPSHLPSPSPGTHCSLHCAPLALPEPHCSLHCAPLALPEPASKQGFQPLCLCSCWSLCPERLSPATTSSGFYILHRQPSSFTRTPSHMQSQSPIPPPPSAYPSLCQPPHHHSSPLLQTVSISKAETRPGLFTTESQRWMCRAQTLAHSRCSVNIDWPEEGRLRLSKVLAGRGHSRQTDQSRRFRVEQAAVITGRQASHSQSHASHNQSYGFPVVMCGCESWTLKNAELWRIDAFELWCWRRLLRVPWTAGDQTIQS